MQKLSAFGFLKHSDTGFGPNVTDYESACEEFAIERKVDISDHVWAAIVENLTCTESLQVREVPRISSDEDLVSGCCRELHPTLLRSKLYFLLPLP